jgi:anti-anti-sigma regulatory factor
MKMIAAGMTPRVREVFKLTRVDAVVPIAASVEEAEAS